MNYGEVVLSKFSEIFGDLNGVNTYFAPGRVNLIGEHTDYNGGHVFPCALTIGTYAAARKRDDDKINLYSLNFEKEGLYESSLNDLKPYKEAGWTNYPKGVVWAFLEKGYKVDTGLDMVIIGDIPAGSGLSSSASLEVLTGLVLKDLFSIDVSMVDIALIGQYSENKFNGMNCGIMDQFASAMGKADNAIFLDTATLEYDYAPIKLPDAKIVITNSKVKHALVDSAYNERRSSCERALKALQELTDIKALGELSEPEFENIKDKIESDEDRKRAKHAVYENQRTIMAVEALKANDIEEFGRLMNESHISLRDDYETSCPECDILAEEAWKIEGVIGSRITGGGFGGCTVSLVKNGSIDAFVEKITAVYKEKTGIDCEIYVVDVGEGAHKL